MGRRMVRRKKRVEDVKTSMLGSLAAYASDDDDDDDEEQESGGPSPEVTSEEAGLSILALVQGELRSHVEARKRRRTERSDGNLTSLDPGQLLRLASDDDKEAPLVRLCFSR